MVTGAGSTWATSAALTIGNYDVGNLRIEAGASVTSDYSYIAGGSTGDGAVTVTGAGSNWILSRDINLGDANWLAHHRRWGAGSG